MATAAAAVMAAARRKVISHLMSHNAVSAEGAVPFDPPRRVQRRQLDRLLHAGVVERTTSGRYWLNIPALDQWRSRMRKRAVGAAIGLTAVGGLLAFFAA